MGDAIPPEELRVETWPIEGIDQRGGQHVGGHRGVRVTHLPTGIMAYVNVGRSQHHARRIAVDMIEAALTHPDF